MESKQKAKVRGASTPAHHKAKREKLAAAGIVTMRVQVPKEQKARLIALVKSNIE